MNRSTASATRIRTVFAILFVSSIKIYVVGCASKKTMYSPSAMSRICMR